jgi:hypothetical protein
MTAYLLLWSHYYFVHFCALVAFCITSTVVKSGIPEFKTIPRLLCAAMVISLVIGFFSSCGHTHYDNALTSLEKIN